MNLTLRSALNLTSFLLSFNAFASSIYGVSETPLENVPQQISYKNAFTGNLRLENCVAKQESKGTLINFSLTNLSNDALVVIEKKMPNDRWYDAIGFLSAEEASNGVFSWTDEVSSPGINTYRIVTLQADGSTETLGAVSLAVKPRDDQKLKVNVTQTDRQWTRIDVETLEDNTALSLELSTDEGVLLMKRNLVLKAGHNEILIPADHLPTGWHTLSVKQNNQVMHVEHIQIGNATNK